MSYRVRTPEGELEFASLYEISNALRHGLVGGEDELLCPGRAPGCGSPTTPRSGRRSSPRAGLRPGSILGGLELGATAGLGPGRG